MDGLRHSDPLLRAVLFAAGLVVIAAGLREAAALVNAVLLAALLALTLLPAKQALMRRGASRPVAVTLVIAVVLLGGAILVAAVGSTIADFSGRATDYQQHLTAAVAQLDEFLATRGLEVGTLAPSAPQLIAFAEALLGGVVAALGWALLGLMLIVLLLLELPLPSSKPTQGTRFQAGLFEIYGAVQQYMAINGAVAGVAALVNLVAMWAFGTDHAVLWAVLSFLLAFVPLGFIVAVIPPVAVTALDHGSGPALALGVIFVVVNAIADNVVKPRYLGEGFGLPLSLVVLAFLGWGFVLGAFGALLAVPLTIALIKAAPLLQSERPH